MAPQRARSLPKNAFSPYFAKLKTQPYNDSPSQRTSTYHIRCLSWNPLGSLIATGSTDRSLRIWNPERPQAKHSTELRGHSGVVERVSFSPVSEVELASCGADGTLKLWDVRSKTCTGDVKVGGEAFTLVFHPEGSELVVGRKDDSLLRIDRRMMAILSNQRQAVQTNQTIFSNSGKALFLTSGDGMVKITSYPSLSLLHTLNAHTSSCISLALSSPGTYLAIGGSDALITLWDTLDWVCVRSLDRMTGPVRTVGFSFDGSFVLGGSDEGNYLEIAHTETGEYVHRIETSVPAANIAWHPSRYILAYSGDSGLRIVGGVGG